MSVHERRRGIAPLRIIEKLDAGDAHTGTLHFELRRDMFKVALCLVRRIPGQASPAWVYEIANPACFAQRTWSAAEAWAVQVMREGEET